MDALVAERDRIVAGFPEFAAARAESEPAWLSPLREAAIGRFAQLGFPSRKREDWKYTNVTPIARALDAGHGPAGAAHQEALASSAATSALAHALVFVDGRFAPELSSPGALPAGAVVDSVANVLRERPQLAQPLLAKPEAALERCFVALNAAFQSDGAFVWLAPGVVLEEPIHLVHLATGAERIRTSHLHNVISLAESASAVVVERYTTVGDGRHLTNAVTDVALADDARLDHVMLERESPRAMHVGTLCARLGRDARFRSHAISVGAALTRNEIETVLAGVGAECVLNGLFLASGERHVDNQTTIDHAATHGTSEELYKGILDGRSKGVFNGKIIVRREAQKTSARQSNPNLLLADGAEINTRPNLEIHADDVKCTHGSTVGHLDDDALFFLQSRGIGAEVARKMLSQAFAAEVIDRVPSAPVREEVARCVAAAIGWGGGKAS